MKLKVELNERRECISLEVDEIQTVGNVIILLVYQNPHVLEQNKLHLYRLVIISKQHNNNQQQIILDKNEPIGSYHVIEEAGDILRLSLKSSLVDSTSSSFSGLGLGKFVVPEEELVKFTQTTLFETVRTLFEPLQNVCLAVGVIGLNRIENEDETSVVCFDSREPQKKEIIQRNSKISEKIEAIIGKTPVSRASKQLEVSVLPANMLRWPFLTDLYRIKILILPLRAFATLVFDKNTTVDDAILLLWQCLRINHSSHLELNNLYYTFWGLKQQNNGDDFLCAEDRLFDACYGNSQNEEEEIENWDKRTFVFCEKPRLLIQESLQIVDFSITSQMTSPSSTPPEIQELLCVILFVETGEFYQKSFQSNLVISSIIEIASKGLKERRIRKDSKFDISNYDLFLVTQTGNSAKLFFIDPNMKLSDVSSSSVLTIQCKYRPKTRKLAVLFGISHTIAISVPQKNGKFNTGLFAYEESTKLSYAALKISSSLGIQNKQFEFLLPDRLLVIPGIPPKGDLNRTFSSYWLLPNEKLILLIPEQQQPPQNQLLFPELIPGEKLLVSNVEAIRNLGLDTKNGLLFITQYRIFFVSNQNNNNNSNNDIQEMPLAMICGIEITNSLGLRIILKDFRAEVFTISNIAILKDVHKAIVIPTKAANTFAFFNATRFTILPNNKGWSLFNAFSEFSRIGFPPSEWRITYINNDFSICSTYPKKFVVPFMISDSDIRKISAFRRRGRVPAVCWISKNGASLTRCSQPLNGWGNVKRCIEDETFFSTLLKLSRNEFSNNKLYILDARQYLSATANTFSGGGTESDEVAYPNCVLKYLSIGNIRDLRMSYIYLANLCIQPFQSDENDSFLKDLEATGWMYHVQKILKNSVIAADLIFRGTPVVVHCSDGWDRTSQIVSLCQLLLDPFYRTIHGFAVLIEKEWIAFGHQFFERSGIGCVISVGGVASQNDRDFSPIFNAFLDCVWQILQQFPTAFEFNENLLITLADSVYSALFGTFLFSNEQERIKVNAYSLTLSVWCCIFENKSQFINSQYHHISQPLFPTTTLGVLRFWTSYYLRYSSKHHHTPSSIHQLLP